MRTRVDPARVAAVEAAGQRDFEESLLTGYSRVIRSSPPLFPDPSRYAANFSRYLEQFRANASVLDPATFDRAIYATSLIDSLDAVNEVLREQRIPADDFEALGVDGINRFLQAQPMRRLDMHLRRQFVADRSLKAKPGDLNDWAYLGVAVMYCHAAVIEKQFASLVRRPGLVTRATVMTKLEDLAAWLADGSGSQTF
ncbi:MAG: hypothetical protein ABI939_10575 [Anaerolineaceae bacterium]